MIWVSIAVFVGYYWGFKQLLGHLARRAVRWMPSSRFTSTELYALLKTLSGIVSQALLIVAVIALVPATRLPVSSVDQLLQVPAGVLLGVAEMAASIIAAMYAVRLFGLFGFGLPAMVWVDSSRGGWMGSLASIRQSLPTGWSTAIVVAQVGCEEVMFRQCFPLLIGGAAGHWAGAVLFTVMQVFGMPGWRSALFPVIGAAIMGAVHAYVFAQTSLIVPLIVAHAVSFFAASRTRLG